MKLLKSCWITAICLNFLILAERLVQRIIIQWTGYFIPNENFGAFVQFTVGFTVFTLIATLIRQFSYFERQRRKHQQERSFHHLYLLLFTLLYGSIGLFVSMLINFWSIIPARKAIYYSPSGNKAVVFLERTNFFLMAAQFTLVSKKASFESAQATMYSWQNMETQTRSKINFLIQPKSILSGVRLKRIYDGN